MLFVPWSFAKITMYARIWRCTDFYALCSLKFCKNNHETAISNSHIFMQNVPKCFARTTMEVKFTEFYADFIYYPWNVPKCFARSPLSQFFYCQSSYMLGWRFAPPLIKRFRREGTILIHKVKCGKMINLLSLKKYFVKSTLN